MNKFIVTGNLGGEHELSESKNNDTKILKNSIAVYHDKQNTDWFSIVVFNKTAEYMAENTKKGDKVLLEGSLHISKWQDKEGNNRYTNEFVVSKVEKLSFEQKENNKKGKWNK